ncbi:hypothetical protein PCANC_14748 [Puccinia coronata f. sp. avenae]|uniref:Uncharacterized protein n=1 Tax=Puccinia coronata f. sp. avenae TaxID=200324 RepID=A0A2N5SIK5_9BASI|nr:hypothetical protein PCANC_14748 [Puccinia coronata f. sp. avenae]PLW23569.1 hypothetical protein PCASD_09086 [Puccinia coronata f. sp. avenae]
MKGPLRRGGRVGCGSSAGSKRATDCHLMERFRRDDPHGRDAQVMPGDNGPPSLAHQAHAASRLILTSASSQTLASIFSFHYNNPSPPTLPRATINQAPPPPPAAITTTTTPSSSSRISS